MKRRRRLNFPLALDFISAPKTQGVALGYPVMRFQRVIQPAEDQTNPRPETLVESVFNLFAKKL